MEKLKVSFLPALYRENKPQLSPPTITENQFELDHRANYEGQNNRTSRGKQESMSS
jgi:hypothetical protein